MRIFALAFGLTAGLALAQAAPGAGGPPAQSEGQQCQMKCAQAMQKCMEPCMPKSSGGIDKAGGKNAIASCAKNCGMQQQPCMAKCNGGKKGAKKHEGDEP